MSTKVDAPPPRDMGKEARDTIQAQQESAPQSFANYAEFTPQYDKIDLQRLSSSLFGTDKPMTLMDINQRLTDNAAQQSRQANTMQRSSDVSDVRELGGVVQGQLKNANRELFRNLDRLDAAAGNGGQSSTQGALQNSFANGPQVLSVNAPRDPFTGIVAGNVLRNSGPSDIQKSLEDQARSELALGRNLSPEEIRQSQQSSRAAFEARGLGDSNASIANEVLSQQKAGDDRLAARRAFAANVDNQGFGQRQQGIQSQFGLLGANTAQNALGLEAQRTNAANSLQAQGMRDQLGLSLLGAEGAQDSQKFNQLLQATGARQSTFFDPYQGVLGRSSVNQGTNSALLASGNNAIASNSAAGRQQFDPFSQYASSLYGQNSAQANSNAQANAAASNAITGGLISAGGSALGSM